MALSNLVADSMQKHLTAEPHSLLPDERLFETAHQLEAKRHADLLNAYISNKARMSNQISYMASPVTGGGIAVGRFAQLFLLAISQGKHLPGEWAAIAWQVLSAHGQRLANGGVTLESAEENLAELTKQAEAFYGPLAKSLLLVDYELLAHVPHKVMPIIYEFIGEPWFAHDFDHVEYDAHEFDTQLGVPVLHRVRNKVRFEPRRTVLPPDLFDLYSKMSFWNVTAGSAAHVIAVKASDQPAPSLSHLPSL